jgi:hypothetical protein
MRILNHLFENNRAWAANIRAHDPDFFLKLSRQQAPDYLWIGCLNMLPHCEGFADALAAPTAILRGERGGNSLNHRCLTNTTDLIALSRAMRNSSPSKLAKMLALDGSILSPFR